MRLQPLRRVKKRTASERSLTARATTVHGHRFRALAPVRFSEIDEPGRTAFCIDYYVVRLYVAMTYTVDAVKDSEALDELTRDLKRVGVARGQDL